MARGYWLDLFTPATWREFLDAGGTVSGFKASRASRVLKIRPGDYLLCYLTGISRWIGILEVTGPAYNDTTPIWESDPFPARLPVRVVVALTPETGIPVLEMRDQLSVFQNLKSPERWSGAFRGSPARWRVSDGEMVTRAVLDAEKNPVVRPIPPGKLGRRPVAVETTVGLVTLPEGDEGEPGEAAPTAHTEIQNLLLRLGHEMGHTVFVARNDRGKVWNGQRLGDMPGIREKLPTQFDAETNKIIEHIDVLWLKGNAIAAAFEIESTTSIFSGLLRMSDLLMMQPNLNIPLYLVAPDERRNDVIRQVNRPTFSRLQTPLVDACRFIAFSTLRNAVKETGHLLRFMKVDYIESELAESCEAEGL
jgi:EVE domain